VISFETLYKLVDGNSRQLGMIKKIVAERKIVRDRPVYLIILSKHAVPTASRLRVVE